MKRARKLRLVVCHAPQDEALAAELENHLTSLRQRGTLESWSPSRLLGGDLRAEMIGQRIDEADIILLLLSVDFLSSAHCYDAMLARAMDRHRQGETRVVPILLRAADYQGTLFADLQPIPADGRTIKAAANRDAIWTDVIGELRRIVDALLARADTTGAHTPGTFSPATDSAPPRESGEVSRCGLYYYCYISESKVDQLLAQLPAGALDRGSGHERPPQEDGARRPDAEYVAGEHFGRPGVAQLNNRRWRQDVARKLQVALAGIDGLRGGVPSLLTKMDRGEAIRSGMYHYQGEFSVKKYDSAFVYVEAPLPHDTLLKLTCSLKYFSDLCDSSGALNLHSGNALFLAGEIAPILHSLFYVLQTKDKAILGTPLFLGLPLSSPLQL